LLNVSTEIEGGLLQSAMFKAVVSGDRISASYKHRDGFSFKPVAKHIFAANKFPPIQDTSRGLLRRMMVVETARKFDKVDKDLRTKLRHELDGIFLMLVRHLQLLEADGGFCDDDVPYMVECKARFAESNNPVISFAMQHLDDGPSLRAETMGVYEQYVKFCAKRGYKAKSEQHFGKELKSQYPKMERVRSGSGKRVYFYEGIGLVDDLA
jgi:putative DNA primase/helicase